MCVWGPRTSARVAGNGAPLIGERAGARGRIATERTQVRSVDQLPPLEIVLEVRGTQAIPTSFRVVAQRAVRPIT